MSSLGYHYHFVMNKYDYYRSNDSILQYKKLYKFKSPKSHQWYMVWVECYRHHFYAVKFHLKNHRYSDNKYRYMTKLNEARQVIHTCINIMLEIAMEDDLSSFGFIGANSIGESIKETKRFQVYKILMATYFSEEHFLHVQNVNKSAYVMIRKEMQRKRPEILDELNDSFISEYDYFE